MTHARTRRSTVKVHACVAHMPSVGPISSDTVKATDLIPTFTEAADAYVTSSSIVDLASEHDMSTWELHDQDRLEALTIDTLADLEEALTDMLDNASPPYAHFGASDGDGACFGWWPDVDRLMDSTRHGWVKCADMDCDGAMEPDDRLCARVNDHGNVTLAHVACDGGHHEIWSVV